MKKIILLASAVLLPAAAFGQAVAFTFETPGLPATCELGSGGETATKSAAVRHEHDAEREGGVCVTEDVERGGVFVRDGMKGTGAMAEPVKQMTVAMAFRSNPVSTSPVFMERIVASSSNTPGFFRFRAQRNGGDDHERRGTLRFGVTGPDGQGHTATSTISWSQLANAWNWVGMVYDQGRVTFYLNGEELGEPVEVPVQEIPGTEGRSYFVRSGYSFIGAFDDLVFLPQKALSSDEMRALFQKGPTDDSVKPVL